MTMPVIDQPIHFESAISWQQSVNEPIFSHRDASRFESVLNLLPAGVILLDETGRVEHCNAAAKELLGEPLLNEQWLDVITRSFSPRHDDGHEVSLKDGRRVSIATRSLDDGPGQMLVLNDLTETRELQAKLSRHERLSAMGRMMASLAHQVRTPLSAAVLYANHLSEPQLSDELRENCTSKLLDRLRNIEHQIKDMLIFVKGETRMAEKLTLSDFELALKAACEKPIQQAKAKIVWHNQAPETRIVANIEALTGACMNLIGNSIDAKKEDLKIDIRIEAVDEQFVEMVFQDNGPGFSRDLDVKEAFVTTKSHGTGLGLAIVQTIVEAHRGRFSIQSNESGALARIVLPVIDA